MNRAYSVLEIKAVSDDDRIIEGIATTPTPDRMGDIVEPDGAKFALPIPLLWQHDSASPIGHVETATANKRGVKFRATIAKVAEPGRLKDRLDEVWQSLKANLVRGVSVGFKPLEYAFMDDGGVRFSSWEWLELSLVTIPANAEATIIRIKSIDAELRAASGQEQGKDRHEPPPASRDKSKPVKLRPKEGREMKTISEQITDWEGKRAALAGRMEAIMEKSAESGETLDAEQTEEYDGVAGELTAVNDHLKRLRDMEELKAATAKPAEVKDARSGSDARSPIIVKQTPKADPGINFARLARAKAIGYLDHEPAREVAKHLYGENSPVVGVLTKATVTAGSTISGNWAEDLVGDETSVFADFVEYLRPMTIVGKFGNNGVPNLRRVPFRTPLVGQTGGGQAYWVGEGAPKPLTAFDFSRTTLNELKVATISVVTEELLRQSSPSADMILRDALAAAVAERIDIDFIDPDKTASAGVSPASITNGVTAITSTGNDADSIREDIRLLFAEFIAANNPPTSGVWVMSAGTGLALGMLQNPLGQAEFPGIGMNGGSFMGLPTITSEYFSAVSAGGFVALVNAQDIYFADEGGVQVDVSREASLQMLDNPTNASSTGTATTMVSMFQTNSVAFRAERILNWAKRRASAVAVLDSVNWGQPSGS